MAETKEKPKSITVSLRQFTKAQKDLLAVKKAQQVAARWKAGLDYLGPAAEYLELLSVEFDEAGNVIDTKTRRKETKDAPRIHTA